jgi:hypothetical protein
MYYIEPMQRLNATISSEIDRNGFRISPRLDTMSRLSRFIQLHSAKNGRILSDSEATACATLVLMKYTSPKRTTDNVMELVASVQPSDYKPHSMRLRSMA